MKKDSQYSNQVIVGPVRLDWVELFKPKVNKLKEPPVAEYSCTLLFPKEDGEITVRAKEEIKQVMAFIKEQAKDKFGDQLPKGFKNPFKDGDVEDDQGNKPYPGYFYMRVTAKEEYPPKLVNGAKEPVTEGWGSGDWACVKLAFYCYDVKINKGVSAGIRAVQFMKHDTRLGGGGEVSVDDFDEFEVEENKKINSSEIDEDFFA